MGKNSTLRSTKYQPVDGGALENEETVSFLEKDDEFQCPYHHQHSSIAKLPWIWIASTVFFMLLSLTLTTKDLRISRSFETGFATDLEAAWPSAELKQLSFTGGLLLDQNNTLYRQIVDGPQYAGAPSPEIDGSWDKLLGALEIVLEGEEAATIAGTTKLGPNGKGWQLSIDVYHSLHCVDVVRRGLDNQYYHPDGKFPYFYRDHLDHCVDYLRQVVQCNSDLTPLRYVWNEELSVTLPVFGQVHTCRNFQKVQEWAMARSRVLSHH